jgi:NADH dehydrogenase [ubiquinone] 1 alpha subcomplex assembly factor 1
MASSTGYSAPGLKAPQEQVKPSYVLSFNELLDLENWQVTNDGVMGGLSEGKTQVLEQALNFYGRVSTQNNGGFTSVYLPLATLPKSFEYLKITVQGDGRPYQLRLRSRAMAYNIVYQHSFATEEGKVQSLSFKLADFAASFRGRIITDAPVLTAQSISHVGFLISSKQNTQFSLSTSEIEFY